jgi:nitrogen-specific signal transduction histidine kinase
MVIVCCGATPSSDLFDRALSQVATKQAASYDVILKVFDRIHKIMHRLELSSEHNTTNESKRDLARILPQILVIISCSTKSLKDYSFRLRVTSIRGPSQSVFANSEPLQSALDELERLAMRAAKIRHIPGTGTYPINFIPLLH